MAKIPTDANLVSPMGNLRQAVAIGAIPGWRAFRKFGLNPDVDNSTEDVWSTGGVRVLPSTYGTASIVSGSAQDAAAGTGISQVTIEGLDENWAEQSLTVTLTGQTPVVTTGTTWARVHRMYGVAVGSGVTDPEATGATAAGAITCTVDSNVQCSIRAGNGQSLLAGYSVPAGHTLLIDSIHWSTGRVGAQDVAMSLEYKKFGENVWRSQVRHDLYEESSDITGTAMTFPAKSDIRVQATTGGTNIDVSAEFDGYLINNSTQGNFG